MLSVVATPIGNLRDITLRALDALAAADVIACEDTRRTRALLTAHSLRAPEVVACDERRELALAPRRVARALAGEQVVLVSDAGLPAVADPGRELIRCAIEAGCPLTVLPGASSIETALVASGLAAEGYCFCGWPPRRAGERRSFLAAALARELPQVLLESPRRLVATLAELAELAADREIAVARELTKLHEEVVRGTASAVSAAGVREQGELCIVVAGATPVHGEIPSPAARRVLELLIGHGVGVRESADAVAQLSGETRRELYAAASSLRQASQTARP